MAHDNAGVDTIAPPKHLFTWVDVDEHIALLAELGEWPTWLREAESWWDGLELTVDEGTESGTVTGWLNAAFGAGSVETVAGLSFLKLDDPRTVEFVGMPIRINYESGSLLPSRRLPLLRDKRITAFLSKPLPRPENDRLLGDVQLLAFHSFKGGVGRTIHAVALADAVARRGHHVLLIDADLEAPGITWMYRSQGGRIDFSYEDLIALLHSSDHGDFTPAVEIATAYLPNQELGRYPDPGRVTVVPATRREVLGPPRIEPADLFTPDRSPYFLTNAIAALAASVGADSVVIDLRAGASELSSPVLLDPRVQRIFVTSMSHQSLAGTKGLLRQLGRRAPTVQGQDPASSVIITQYRADVHEALVEREREQISGALFETLLPTSGPAQAEELDVIDADVLSRPILSPFREELLALPSSWDAVARIIDGCRVAESLESILPGRAEAVSVQSAGISESDIPDYPELRRRLEHTAQPLIYAEQQGLSAASGFLVTDSLSRLLSDHRTDSPLALVVGSKGAGKTFLYAKACVAKAWNKFAEKSGISGVQINSPIVPVLESDNLEPGEITTQDLRDSFAAQSGFVPVVPNTSLAIKDRLKEGIGKLGEDEFAWRQLWLECLAIACGCWSGSKSPEEELISLGKTAPAIFVIDGLEDLLQSINTGTKATALRVLLIDVLAWLRSLRGHPLGLIVFVRQDLVTSAVRQNSGQLLARYESYALRWDKEEALRLALWVTVRADALPASIPEADITNYTYDELVEALIPVWGWKMGTEKSKEARSHLWVPAALGDFRDQVQARDVVVFLAEAARESISQTAWEDRVLVPNAMRKALIACSANKIESIRQENQDVGTLLQRLKDTKQPVTVPFELDEVGLTVEDANFLIESGVFARGSDGRYWVAEIYRHGLGFGSERRAKVLWRR